MAGGQELHCTFWLWRTQESSPGPWSNSVKQQCVPEPLHCPQVTDSKCDLPACVSGTLCCQSDIACLDEEKWPRYSFPESISRHLTDCQPRCSRHCRERRH
ncbi:hypothetical protein AV530_002517 [Patagioenas fasciata monilis]|uniref:Uncharacterized protein n=1 Tax=Patagioenas fasciata monilis TaxID=372326 RepID=A0A1V4K6R5_PATFA|nr:hypothetical protein AV530_002517 [Patagioenas fasciata monilis]